MVAAPGDIVLTQRFTYSGMIALSAQNGYRLHGIDSDGEGLLPDALERAFSETGARVLFASPTLQTPTGTVMGLQRRRQIAEIIRKTRRLKSTLRAAGWPFPAPSRDQRQPDVQGRTGRTENRTS
jgi:DNA-binding transcriptional MocR family regulator